MSAGVDSSILGAVGLVAGLVAASAMLFYNVRRFLDLGESHNQNTGSDCADRCNITNTEYSRYLCKHSTAAATLQQFHFIAYFDNCQLQR